MRRKRHLDDQEDDDQLFDGQSLRVPLSMADGWQDDMAQHFHRRRESEPARITDANGNSGLSLMRPGFRLLDCSEMEAARVQVERAHWDYRTWLASAYRDSAKNPPTGAGEREMIGQREGDACTINGNPGHLRRGPGGKLVCVRTASSRSADDRAIAYASYDAWLQNAWRRE